MMNQEILELKIDEYERVIENTIFIFEHLISTSKMAYSNIHYPQHHDFYRGRASGLRDACEQLKMEKEKLNLFFDYLDKSEV